MLVEVVVSLNLLGPTSASILAKILILSSKWSDSIMLLLNMSVESRIGQVPLTTATVEVAACCVALSPSFRPGSFVSGLSGSGLLYLGLDQIHHALEFLRVLLCF